MNSEDFYLNIEFFSSDGKDKHPSDDSIDGCRPKGNYIKVSGVNERSIIFKIDSDESCNITLDYLSAYYLTDYLNWYISEFNDKLTNQGDQGSVSSSNFK